MAISDQGLFGFNVVNVESKEEFDRIPTVAPEIMFSPEGVPFLAVNGVIVDGQKRININHQVNECPAIVFECICTDAETRIPKVVHA